MLSSIVNMNSAPRAGNTMAASILQEHIKRINKAAGNLSESLLDSGHPIDSLSGVSTRKLTDSRLETRAEVSRLALIDTCYELLEHLTRPEDFLKFSIPIVSDQRSLSISSGLMKFKTIQFNSAMAVIVHFEFAGKVPEQGHISFEELAKRTQLHVEKVQRILRCTVAYRVFCEEPLGYISHTAISKCLLNPGLKAWLGHQFEEMLPSSAKLIDAFEMYPGVDDDTETAFSVAFSGQQRTTYWEVLQKTPWKVKRFCDALEYIPTSGGAGDFRVLISCYDWKKLGGCKLVDVGGSTGRVSIAIAEIADPAMEFVIQDLPEVEAEALNTIPEPLSRRMVFRPHDFFKPQPTLDARVYMYRQILHDWPDGKAVDILVALIPALDPGDYLLLVETVQPDPQTLPNSVERLIYAADLLMMAKHNSKERTLGMWKDLLRRASPNFVLENVISPENSGAQGAIIEIRWWP